MKRFLSIFLAFSMLLAMLTVPTMAEGENGTAATSTAPDYSFTPVTIPNGATTVPYNGKTYQVIRTAAEFLAMKGTDGEANYILAQDIDFTGATYTTSGKYDNRNACHVPGVADVAFHLEGNGFALRNITFTNGLTGGGLFATGFAVDLTHTITNLNVYITSVNLNANGAGFFYGQTYQRTPITFTNVNVNVNGYVNKAAACSGIYVAKAEGPTTFNNCVLSGKMDVTTTSNSGNGGFVGMNNHSKANITFNDCDFTATYTSNYSATAAYLGFYNSGASSTTVTFNRCDASGNFTLNTTGAGAGVYIGIVYAKGVSVDFNDCAISGTCTFAGNNASGGYIGRVNNETPVINFNNCTANGTYKVGSTSTASGAYIGKIDTANTINFVGCDATGSFESAGAPSGVYVGQINNSSATVTFSQCDYTATNYKSTNGKTAVFVGYNKGGTAAFNNCTVTGKLNCSSGQSSAFLGCVDNAGNANFSNCTVDATVYFASNKSGFFVGQAFTDGTVNLTDCAVSGIMVSASDCNGAFVGVAGGAYTSKQEDGTYPEPSRSKAKVNFVRCDVDALVIATGTASAFVGSSNAGNPTITYDACENNATIYSFGTAGAWYGGDTTYYGYETTGTTITVKENCVNNATIYAAARATADDGKEDVENYVDTTVNFNTVSAEAMADGSYAYAIAQAQIAKGMTTNIVGQTIDTDATPKVGGKTVYQFVTKVGTFYSNADNYVFTVGGTGEPSPYKQFTAEGEDGTFDARFVIAVTEAKLAEIAKAELVLTFTKDGEVVNTITFKKHEMDAYYAVYSGERIAQAAEGYVLLAVTVTGIPTAEWAPEDGYQLTLTVTDANGDAIPEYTLA